MEEMNPAALLEDLKRLKRLDLLKRDVFERLRKAERLHDEEWARVRTKEDWERYRDVRLQALRRRYGCFYPRYLPLRAETTRTLRGDGFTVENLVIAAWPGAPLTANLYLPDPPREEMPGIIVSHTRHGRGKEDEGLQVSAATWARQGAVVLVPDRLGFGERRQNPYGGRQNHTAAFYHGLQLDLAGESLLDWLAADIIRGVDVLLARPGVAADKIIAVGAVAGGAEPAVLAAVLDERISCLAPFNFATKPEWAYDSWEPHRSLYGSARDGFLPWLLSASVAPRYFIYAHEFGWDRDNDFVWDRLRTVFRLYEAEDRLDYVHGWGTDDYDGSCCYNVGPVQRERLHLLFERWFGLPAPKEEYSGTFAPEELSCRTAAVEAKLPFYPLHKIAGELAAEKVAAAGVTLAPLTAARRQEALRQTWRELLGEIEPTAEATVVSRETQPRNGYVYERVVLALEQNIKVPLLLFVPTGATAAQSEAGRRADQAVRPPTVVGVAQEGKERFCKERVTEITELLSRGLAVCLPDLRGTGEAGAGESRGWNGEGMRLVSTTEAMLAGNLLGLRLRDLRGVLRWLRSRTDLDGGRIALWGDSFAAINPPDLPEAPMRPRGPWSSAEPLGALAALLTPLFEPAVKAVVARKGPASWLSFFESWRFCLPRDAVVRDLARAGELDETTAALAPLPLWLESFVVGRNRKAGEDELRRCFAGTIASYARHSGPLELHADPPGGRSEWLAAHLYGEG